MARFNTGDIIVRYGSREEGKPITKKVIRKKYLGYGEWIYDLSEANNLSKKGFSIRYDIIDSSYGLLERGQELGW